LILHLSNSVSDECAMLYLARKLEQHSPMPEETEELMVKKMPFEDAYQMVVKGLITDAMSVALIERVKLMMMNGELM
jgi:ADP-ribose pyrophosphatase